MVMVDRMWRPRPEKAQVRSSLGTGLPTGRFEPLAGTRSASGPTKSAAGDLTGDGSVEVSVVSCCAGLAR